MADEGEHLVEVPTGGGNAVKWIVSLLAVLYVAGSLFFLFNLRERIDELGKAQSSSNAQIADLGKRMQSAEADSETLAKQLGMTKKELASRSDQLQRDLLYSLGEVRALEGLKMEWQNRTKLEYVIANLHRMWSK